MCTGSSWVNEVTGINWLAQTYQDESLHPNTTGYQHWAAALKSFIGYQARPGLGPRHRRRRPGPPPAPPGAGTR